MGKVGRPFKAKHDKKGKAITVYLLPEQEAYLRKVQRCEGDIGRSAAMGVIVKKAMTYDDMIAKRIEETKRLRENASAITTPIDTLGKSIDNTVKAYQSVRQELETFRGLALLQDQKGTPDA
jgi:hypothetical protein